MKDSKGTQTSQYGVVAVKGLQHRWFSVNFWKHFRIYFFKEHHRRTTSELYLALSM